MSVRKKRRERWFVIAGVAAFFSVLVLFVFTGDNLALLKSIFLDDLSSEALRERFSTGDWHEYIMVSFLAAMQVVCTFLPAEPVQVLSAFAFGFWRGVLCCMIGVFVGNTVIFLLQKTFGDQLRDYCAKSLKLDMDKLAKSKKCMLLVFILYFLPAIPYGMICFFAASTGMRYRRYITVTLLGSLPSVCIGVGLGFMAVASSRVVTLCVLVVLVALLLVMFIKKDALFAKVNAFAEDKKQAKPIKKPNSLVLGSLYFILRAYYALCGVRIKATNRVGKLQGPAIVLCNHGSFVDFVFAAALLRKFRPNFVVARLYFYDKFTRWVLTLIGGFPKSMFAMDPGSTKNCLRVLRSGGILGMMPEARLSTTGRFEDIQNNTYSFLKKCGVPVYTVKFGGDYFADPKWGKGFRRGAVVEAELDILFTARQLEELSLEQIKAAVEQRLDYNEFTWLKERPHIHYRSRRMAEGLENILTLCPVCGQKYTLTTKKHKVFCETCGYLTSLDDRYGFTGNFQFADLTQWYDWQTQQMRKAIAQDPDFVLTAQVELRLPSKGRGMTRSAGHGTCTLSRQGLQYTGTRDGEQWQLTVPMDNIYRLLFGAGVNFEIYLGTEILFFVPREKRSCVDWYIASMLLHGFSEEPALEGGVLC